MADSPFLIVGGGIAGLAAGLGLARIGKPSHIFEKAPSFDEIGAGLQLGPNAVRALQWLGAWDAVAPHCVAPAEIQVRDGISGNILQRIPLGAEFEKQFGAPYRVAHRADLQNALLESVRSKPDIKLQTNAEVTDVSIAETTLTLKSGKTFTGQAIIAADGVHSTIRNLVIGQHGKKPSGHTLHRGLVPIGSIPASANADVVTLWLYPGGHVVHYAVSNGKHFNIVAAVEDSEISLGTAFQRACKPLAEFLLQKSNGPNGPPSILRPRQSGAKIAPCSSAMPPTPACPISPRVPPWRSKMPACCPLQYKMPLNWNRRSRISPSRGSSARQQFKKNPASSAGSIMPRAS